MRASIVLVSALSALLTSTACTPKPSGDSPPAGGQTGAGSGGAATPGGSGGAPVSGTGGTAAPGTGGTPATGTGGTPATGTGGTPAPGTGGTAATDTGPSPSPDGDPPAQGGGKALLVVGTIPILGTDVEFEKAFKAKGMEVEIVQESKATPANAEGKRVIMLSYSMKSTAFEAEAFTTVPVPIIVTEQNLLPRIKMSEAHGFTPSNLTKITMIADNHELMAGFPKGEVLVYMKPQEMFWGVPSAEGIRIAHITGQPDKITYFAYTKGAMMAGVAAPAKRVQFFHATHSPDPIDRNLYLNENGLKLLGATIDWCLK